MRTQSNLPSVTANFQKLSNEELFNGLITLIIPINIRLLKKPYTDFDRPISSIANKTLSEKIQLHHVAYALLHIHQKTTK